MEILKIISILQLTSILLLTLYSINLKKHLVTQTMRYFVLASLNITYHGLRLFYMSMQVCLHIDFHTIGPLWKRIYHAVSSRNHVELTASMISRNFTVFYYTSILNELRLSAGNRILSHRKWFSEVFEPTQKHPQTFWEWFLMLNCLRV